MALQEVSGGTEDEISQMRSEHYQSSFYEKHGLEFETAYCLSPIGCQPDDYDGPQRYCRQRASKYDGQKDEFTPDAYAPGCRVHGGTGVVTDPEGDHLPDNAELIPIKHGLEATDENLQMDFTDAEQKLYDGIMDGWPAAYDWPDREDDPARYQMLEVIATNLVRRQRAEDYLDEDGEVHLDPVFDDQGVEVGHREVENPIASEYRLLLKEILDHMKELGLTPKERQRMDTMEAEEDQRDAVSEIAQEALGGGKEYDPSEFDNG